MSSRIENHPSKVTLYIKQIKLLKNFKAKLQFQIKIHNKVSSRSARPIQFDNNYLKLQDIHEFEIMSQFDTKTNTYHPQYISIVIYLQQENQKLASGHVRFNLFEKDTLQRSWVMPIDRSNDSEAELIFRTTTMPMQNKSKAKSISSKDLKQSNIEQLKFSSTQQAIVNQQKPIINQPTKIELEPAPRIKNVKFEQQQNENNKTQKKSLKNTVSPQEQKSPDFQRKQIHKRTDKPLPPRHQKMNHQIQSINIKIKEEHRQRLHSIDKLKREIYEKGNRGDQSKKEDKEIKVKEKQVIKLKERIRQLQRKQKEYRVNVEDLKYECERIKLKLNTSQKKREEAQNILTKKQSEIRLGHNKIKKLNEQIQELTSKEITLIKRMESKEIIFKQQVLKLQQKLKEAEILNKVTISEKMEALNKQTEKQLHYQEILKQKNRVINEEKLKIKLKEEEWQVKERKFINEQRRLTDAIQKLQEGNKEQHTKTLCQKDNYCKQLSLAQQILNKTKIQLNIQQQQIISKFDAQVKLLKSTNQQLISDKNESKQTIRRLQFQIKEYLESISKNEENIKLKHSQILKNNNKLANMKKDNDNIQFELTKISKQNDMLKQHNVNLNKKMLDLRDKLQNQRLRREQAIKQLQSYYKQMKIERQETINEIKELKWIIINNKDSIGQLQNVSKEQSDRVFHLRQELMAKNQRIISLEEAIKIAKREQDQLIKEKHQILTKFKELFQENKQTTNQLLSEVRHRQKLQQKLQEQKYHTNHLILINKQKQSNELLRYNDKQQILMKRQEQLNNLELQLTRKKESINILQKNNESILREINLHKSQNQVIKNELLVLQKNCINFNKQNQLLLEERQKIITDLNNSTQKITNLQNHSRNIQKQFKQSSQNTMQFVKRIFADLFKSRQYVHLDMAYAHQNVDKDLLSSYIEFIQVRNQFVNKYENKLKQLQETKESLNMQVTKLTKHSQLREEQLKKTFQQEQDKFKGLVYESMDEKNMINNELLLERSEKEHLFKEMQRLKHEILKKQDLQDELNGQLHLMLLQYDGLKIQNQDLSQSLFKYKENQIIIHAEHQQKISLANEQALAKIEKVSNKLRESQRQIINLEKKNNDSSESIKRLQNENLMLKDQKRSLNEANFMNTKSITNLQLEITKLNNSLKAQQKNMINSKANIEKLQLNLDNSLQKIHHLQNHISKCNEEIFQTKLQKQKVIGQMKNLHQNYNQLKKILYEKGETSKQKLKQRLQQNAELKNNLIQMRSDKQLKQFLIKERQKQINKLLQDLDEGRNEISRLRSKLKQNVEINQSNELRFRDLGKQLQQVYQDRDKKQAMLGNANFHIFQINNQLHQLKSVNEKVDTLERESTKKKQQKNSLLENHQKQVKQYRQQIKQLKKQVNKVKKSHRQEEIHYEHEIKKLQHNHNDDYKSLLQQLSRQRKQFDKKIKQIEQYNRKIGNEWEDRYDRCIEEINLCKETIQHYEHERQAYQKLISKLKKENDSLSNNLQVLQQKNNYYKSSQKSLVVHQQKHNKTNLYS